MTQQSTQTAAANPLAAIDRGPGSRSTVDRLDCYRLALVVAAEAPALVPRGHASLRDQIDRASASVCLNTAEGVGRWQPREKAHFYAIARGSALEAAAAVDILSARRLASSQDCAHVAAAARRVALMLGGLIRSVGAGRDADSLTRPARARAWP